MNLMKFLFYSFYTFILCVSTIEILPGLSAALISCYGPSLAKYLQNGRLVHNLAVDTFYN